MMRKDYGNLYPTSINRKTGEALALTQRDTAGGATHYFIHSPNAKNPLRADTILAICIDDYWNRQFCSF